MNLIYTFLKIVAICTILFLIVSSIRQSGLSPHFINPEFTYARDIRFHMGDDRTWSNPNFDDTHWARQIKDSTGIFWVRVKVNIETPTLAIEGTAMQVEFLASYECFWDGVKMGANGIVGNNDEEEMAGNLFKVLAIPDSLAGAGQHTIAFRASNQNGQGKIRFWGMQIGAFDKITRSPLQFTVAVMIFSGIFLVIGIYYLFMFFIPYRKRAYLLFGCLNLTVFALIGMEYMKFYYHYPYSFHYQRLDIIEWISVVFFFLLISFYLANFNLPKKIWIWAYSVLFLVMLMISNIGEYLMGNIYTVNHDLALYILALLTFSISTLVVIRAIVFKNPGSHEALIGILPCFLIIFYYDLMLFLGFVNLVVFNLISLSHQLKIEKELQQASMLRSLRLESEMLRKNLQPHFIMNTLTSVMEWIEQDAKTSIKFIQALADEFKILNSISTEKLISLEQEIDLCRVHLKIMSYRKGISYNLEISDVPLEETIPPAIFHSLIENGISYSRPISNELTFHLSYQSDAGQRVYRFFNDQSVSHIESPEEGIGTKYIKSRLEESYGSRWSFSHGPKLSGWETIIRIPIQV